MLGAVFPQSRDDNLKRLYRAHQAYLDNTRLEVVHHRLYLLLHHRCRNIVELLDAVGGLCRDACDYRHSITAQRRHRLDVCLNARAACGVAARDCQYRLCSLFHVTLYILGCKDRYIYFSDNCLVLVLTKKTNVLTSI